MSCSKDCSSDPGWNPGSDPSSDPGSDPSSNPGSKFRYPRHRCNVLFSFYQPFIYPAISFQFDVFTELSPEKWGI